MSFSSFWFDVFVYIISENFLIYLNFLFFCYSLFLFQSFSSPLFVLFISVPYPTPIKISKLQNSFICLLKILLNFLFFIMLIIFMLFFWCCFLLFLMLLLLLLLCSFILRISFLGLVTNEWRKWRRLHFFLCCFSFFFFCQNFRYPTYLLTILSLNLNNIFMMIFYS